jgi:heat shock protein HslJ
MPHGIPAFVWTLVSFPGVRKIAEPRYSIQFLTDATVAIGADCDRAVGTWSGGEGALDITLGLQTLAACEEGSLEQPYLAALDGFAGSSLSGVTLVLYGAAGDMVFTI